MALSDHRVNPPTMEPRRYRVRGGKIGARKPGMDILDTKQLLKLAHKLLPLACRFETERRLWENRIAAWSAARDMLGHIVEELDGRVRALANSDPIRFASNDPRSKPSIQM